MPFCFAERMVSMRSSPHRATVHRTVACNRFKSFLHLRQRKKLPEGSFSLAEMEGFEPPHALRRLADFESAPFSHLGTSPYSTALLYQPQVQKSRIFPLVFCQIQHIFHSTHDAVIAFPAMGTQTF